MENPTSKMKENNMTNHNEEVQETDFLIQTKEPYKVERPHLYNLKFVMLLTSIAAIGGFLFGFAFKLIKITFLQSFNQL
jgi:hypothetical protein